MFLKFLIGSLALATFLIGGSTYVFRQETRMRSRGNYLAKGARRFQGYIERVGRAMTGQLEILADDDDLVASFKPEPGGGGAGGDGGGEPTRLTAAQIMAHLEEHVAGKNGLKPDVFALFSANNKLLWAAPHTPITEEDLPELAVVEKVRGGSIFANNIHMLHGEPYQVSGVPVRVGDRVVAGMIMGVKLERYMNEWSEQTDDDPQRQWRPVLIDGQQILAAAWPKADRAELARALQPDRVVHVVVGDDERDVVRLPAGKNADPITSGDFDFWVEELEGYKKNDTGVLGKLYIIRSRYGFVHPAITPWTEIFVGIGASLVIAFLMGFWVTSPIKQMVKQSRELLAGETDLTQRIVVRSRDETADLAENINQVFARVHHLASGVQSAAFQVGASSAEISAASRQMLSGLKDQTLKVESSTTAVTELSASIQQVAGNAQQATDVAEQSSTQVNSAVRRMDQIRAAVDDAAAKMRELGESSKRIGNIVEVIRQISEQTSMLALNASIEAAHAGEQGRGFAVVADEVSSLARRVGQSAKDIEALIQTVKEQTQAAIASMDVGTREVVGGSELVTSTLTGLGMLITVVKDTAAAVHEQAVVSDEIARNMDAVRGLAGEALHGSEESVVQAERLHELAFELEESIGGFNLDGSKVGGTRQAAPKPEIDGGSKSQPLLAKPTNGRSAPIDNKREG
jgi:methyl-accepting chemotaxis protein